MKFDKKRLTVTITLVNDQFDDGSNTIVASGLRVLGVFKFGGGNIMPAGEIAIFGLNMPAMLKLTRIRWRDITSMQNKVRVETDGHVVYEGNITFAYIDMSSAPDVAFRIRSVTALYEANRPVAESMYLDGASVVTAIETLAEEMGYRFENNGVSYDIELSETTMSGTAIDKVRKLCRDYRIDYYIDNNLIAIAPQGAPRDIKVPVISPNTGMVGYPVPTMQGVDVRCFYNPAVRFGGAIKITGSVMESCNGEWRAFGVTITLESEVPNGRWHMDIRATHNEPNNVAVNK